MDRRIIELADTARINNYLNILPILKNVTYEVNGKKFYLVEYEKRNKIQTGYAIISLDPTSEGV